MRTGMGIAWVFPGQGSQKIGMAAAVLDLPGARERFSAASELIGRDLLAIKIKSRHKSMTGLTS